MGPPSPNVRPGRRPGRSQPWPTPGTLPPDARPAVLWPGESSPGPGRHSTWTPSGGGGVGPNHVTLPEACRGGGVIPTFQGRRLSCRDAACDTRHSHKAELAPWGHGAGSRGAQLASKGQRLGGA